MQDFLFRQRHPFKLFEVGGRKYVADLVTGQVIPIDQVAWELLKATPEDPEGFVETVRQNYEDTQIYQAIARLWALRGRGILFSPEKEIGGPQEIVISPKERPKLFLSGDFLVRRRQYDFLTNFNHYCLLTALAKKADIYIPITSQEEKEELFDFGEIGIHPLEVQRTGGQSPLKWIMRDCDGILLLNPPVDELFCFEADVPVIVRWEESHQSKREMMEFAISSISLAKEWDAMCFTSSWTKEWFSSFLPQNDHFYTLSSGLSLNPFESTDKQSAKKAVAIFTENEQFKDKPIIGMIPWMELQKAIPFLLKLAQRNPHLAFLVMDSNPIFLPVGEASNIASFGIQSLEDYQACTILFKALDLLCFPATCGTPLSLVLEVLYRGAAPFVLGKEHIPEELGNAGFLIPSTIDRFSNLTVPIEQLETAFTKFLADSVEREKCEAAARNVTLHFSWDKTAEDFLQLLRHLWHQKSITIKTQRLSPPLVFTYYYNPSSRRISPAAFDMEERTYRPLLNGLLHSLEQRHRSPEIEQVLSSIYPEGVKEE